MPSHVYKIGMEPAEVWMKVMIALLVLVSWAGPAAAGKKQDQAAYKDWERMYYDRTLVSGIKAHCPHLSEVGLITTRVDTPSDWSPNDTRYDAMDKYEARGVARGKKMIAKLLSERGVAGYCTAIVDGYGREGKVYSGIVAELPQLSDDELHVTLGEYSTRMTVAEAEAASGSEQRCIERHENVVEYCSVAKGSISFGRRPTRGEVVRMYYTHDGRLYELSRSIDLPEAMRTSDALAQVREKFAMFGEPLLRRNGNLVWRIREGVDVEASVAEERIQIKWHDKTLRDENRSRVRSEIDRRKNERLDNAAREKLKL